MTNFVVSPTATLQCHPRLVAVGYKVGMLKCGIEARKTRRDLTLTWPLCRIRHI